MADMWWLLLVGVWFVAVWLVIQVVSLTRRMEDRSPNFKDGVYQPLSGWPNGGYTPQRPINPDKAPKGQAVATATQIYGSPPPKAPKPPSADSAQQYPDGTKGHIPGRGPRPTFPPPPAPTPNPKGHVYPQGSVPEINPEPNQWQRNKE